ncbi:enoyl-CoA hydratase/isomerase family protein [Rhodococcus sp. ZPP]|uniref:enoyl-CoA hydratase/isomerase family protein n=1 Tax=Rhodococcus sp. ZPP TaxID=2749906 RepID=UPI001AD889F0|nr:enoyl-CoA hydratase/isomerase family protein [Rhodococcus sp. ZPP]QTJ67959.1 enoyl-CoA hydratase/isomerase family protein [Rhodococcus sp. ZPP]QTJ67999.1 enoyl-CoA hydratase/isomerase family protein [Rhodococcus sp. ZPP]
MSEELHVSVDEHVAVLTVDRPLANNSLGGSLLRELLDVSAELERDDSVRVIVTTANVSDGATAWSPGVDFAQLEGKLGPGADADVMFYGGVMQGDHASLGVSAQARRFDPLGPGRWILQMLDNFRKPTIAAINGAVAGGGIGWAGLHTYRIAGESVKFKAAFGTLGFGPDMGASYFVTKLMGQSAATDFLLRDQPMSAEDAHRAGFVNQVVPDGQVLEHSLKVARDLAQLPPLGLRATVRALRGAETNTLAEQLGLEWDNQRITFATEDAAAAFEAFTTRTKGTYVGR